MIARPSTMPTVAPNACRVRARMMPVIEVAASAAKLATTVSARPASITGRRPKRSDSVPSTSCETAMPSRNSESVSCTVPAPAPSVTISAGIAGARMLSESGPTDVAPISSASRRQGCSSEWTDPPACATGLPCARSGSSTERPCGGFEPGPRLGGDERRQSCRNGGVIAVEPRGLVGGHQLRLDQAAVDRREASGSRTRSSASRRRRSCVSLTSTRFSMRMP